MKTLSSLSGRPMSTIMLPPPNIRTITVITSAERVIARRHSAWTMRRMAEISVPACEMPMKNTKLTM